MPLQCNKYLYIDNMNQNSTLKEDHSLNKFLFTKGFYRETYNKM